MHSIGLFTQDPEIRVPTSDLLLSPITPLDLSARYASATTSDLQEIDRELQIDNDKIQNLIKSFNLEGWISSIIATAQRDSEGDEF